MLKKILSEQLTTRFAEGNYYKCVAPSIARLISFTWQVSS